jgi:GT2 family glycosyltransferase
MKTDDEPRRSVAVIVLRHASRPEQAPILQQMQADPRLDTSIVLAEQSSRITQPAGLGVQVVKWAENLGYSQGNQRAIDWYCSFAPVPDFFVISNPDVSVSDPGLLCRLIEELERNESALAASPMVIHSKMTHPFHQVSCNRTNLELIVAGSTLGSRLFRAYSRRALREKQVSEAASAGSTLAVDQINGAFFVAKGDLFLKAGGMSKGLRMFWEEEEMGRRWKKQGFNCILVTGAEVIHEYGSSYNHKTFVSVWRRSAQQKSLEKILSTSCTRTEKLLAQLLFVADMSILAAIDAKNEVRRVLASSSNRVQA